MFINHCAVIIQSLFRGYIKRKRYIQFLPIYRRFKEIISAAAQGWKIRKILNLNIIKAQILDIKKRK